MKMSTSVVKKTPQKINGTKTPSNCSECGHALYYKKNIQLYVVWCPNCRRPQFEEFDLNVAIKGFNL